MNDNGSAAETEWRQGKMTGEDYENGRPRGDREGRLPQWLPQGARHYLAHTTEGRSIRGLARNSGLHPSTVLRQVRRYETRRDDPLIDDALSALAEQIGAPRVSAEKETMQMDRKSDANPGADIAAQSPSESRLRSESLRILRRLVETGAVLAVGRDMDMAVVVRDAPDGSTTRSAVVDRAVAQAMALRDWIACHDPGARVARYHITAAGRSALRELVAASENHARAMAEAPAEFVVARKAVNEDDLPQARVQRFAVTDSPLVGLARRRDKDGRLFLSRVLLAAGERLREDYELSQMDPKYRRDWSAIFDEDEEPAILDNSASGAAFGRVQSALCDLGPGLGDVALRCCCLLEGLETTEQRLGWAARSGKIVLRIALQRLARHYEQQHGRFGPLIG
jgi:lambda repressor-like predicted transcriptional regulator